MKLQCMQKQNFRFNASSRTQRTTWSVTVSLSPSKFNGRNYRMSIEWVEILFLLCSVCPILLGENWHDVRWHGKWEVLKSTKSIIKPPWLPCTLQTQDSPDPTSKSRTISPQVKSTLLHIFDVGSPSRMTMKEKMDTFRTLQKFLATEMSGWQFNRFRNNHWNTGQKVPETDFSNRVICTVK